MIKKKTYSGYYVPKNKSKYVGDKRNIYYRSWWERSFCKWCDANGKVKKWIIEPFAIGYYDTGKRTTRQYNPDFWLEMEDGTVYLIEIKPDYETKPPKMAEGTPKYRIQEATYATNTSKWLAAEKYCIKKGWKFRVVTEKTMKEMGIEVSKKYPRLKVKGTSKKNVKYTNKTSSKGVKRKAKRTGRKKVQKVQQGN